MIMWNEAKHRIDRLQIRSAGIHTSVLRLALSNQFGTADLCPACMPPSATLIVRRLADPLPGRIAPHHHMARVDSTWERAVQNSLAHLYSHAARPGQGPVPANAEAVLFSDEAEMLACLLVDMSRQEARQQWWWRILLRELPDAGAAGMTLLLCRRAAQIPAVLQQLLKYGQAVRVVTALAPAQALAVLAAMSRAYDMSLPLQSEVVVAADLPAATPALSAEARKTSATGHDQALPPPFTASPARATPWRGWLPDSLSLTELTREQLCLLGVGLSLYHAPTLVRSPVFLHSLRGWWLAAATPAVQSRSPPPSAGPPSGPPVVATQPAAQPKQPTVIPAEDSTPVIPAAPFSLAVEQGPVQAPAVEDSTAVMPAVPFNRAAEQSPVQGPAVEDSTAVMPAAPFSRTTEQVADQAPAKTQRSAVEQQPQSNPLRSRPITLPEQSTPAQGRFQPDEPGVSSYSAGVEIQPPAAVPPESRGRQPSIGKEISTTGIGPDIAAVSPDSLLPLPEPAQPNEPADEPATITWRLADGVPTRLGGVWYLINLMAYLDLPDCFEDEWHLATRLGAWGTLEALARALLADSDSVAEDPLWLALAELSGRESGEGLGTDLPDDPDFRLPVAWLTHADNSDPSAYAWASDGQRLCLWSEQGYPLVDVACNPQEIADRAAAELRRYRGDAPFQLHRQCFEEAPLACLDGPLTAGLSPSLRCWLERVIPYLRWRLQRALPGGGADDPREWLCLPGQLYVNSTHVDLVLSLNAVSIPIRLAGLDRDPGWLPEFGRVIKFYFE